MPAFRGNLLAREQHNFVLYGEKKNGALIVTRTEVEIMWELLICCKIQLEQAFEIVSSYLHTFAWAPIKS